MAHRTALVVSAGVCGGCAKEEPNQGTEYAFVEAPRAASLGSSVNQR